MDDRDLGDDCVLFAGIALLAIGLGGYGLIWFVLLSSPMASSL